MSELYRFGHFVLDPRRRTLSVEGSPVFLTPKAFDVLLFLVQNPNRLITKDELLQAVWGDTFVEEGNLTQYVSHLRKALGTDSDGARLIVTIARKGYQFTGTVSVGEATDTGARPTDVLTIETLQAAVEAAQEPLSGTTPSRWRRAPLIVAPAIILGIGLLSWRSFVAGPPRSQRVMLAVLPFQNLTGDPNQEYLADGLTEEMTSQLSRLDQDRLGVIARTSVMGYKHKDERLDQIGRDLSVQYVLESSLRESAGRLRLTAQLIQVKDQTHLWSRDYDYPARDILAVENDVAKAVAQEIKLRLTSQQQAQLGHPYPANPEAFRAYLQGYSFFEKNTNSDSEMAAKYYERAIQLDSSYALPWVGLSRVRNWQVNIGVLPAAKGYPLAREAVARALTLNPNLAAAHVQMGRIKHQLDLDWPGAETSFRRAMALEPGNPEGIRMAAASAAMFGRFDEAVELNRRASALDPLNADNWGFVAEVEFFMGQFDQAEADNKKASELNPDVWPGPIQLGLIHVMQGRSQDALDAIAKIRYEPWRMYLYPMAYHLLGRAQASDAALSDFIAKYPGNEYQIAEVFAFRNQPDEAVEWLERAFVRRNSGLISLKVDPVLKNLQGDPRYVALLKKLNFPN